MEGGLNLDDGKKGEYAHLYCGLAGPTLSRHFWLGSNPKVSGLIYMSQLIEQVSDSVELLVNPLTN